VGPNKQAETCALRRIDAGLVRHQCGEPHACRALIESDIAKDEIVPESFERGVPRGALSHHRSGRSPTPGMLAIPSAKNSTSSLTRAMSARSGTISMLSGTGGGV